MSKRISFLSTILEKVLKLMEVDEWLLEWEKKKIRQDTLIEFRFR